MATPAPIVVWALSQWPIRGGFDFRTEGVVEGFSAIDVEAVAIALEGFERWKRDLMGGRPLRNSILRAKLRIMVASPCNSSLLRESIARLEVGRPHGTSSEERLLP